jgi:hypothetical protein
MRFCVNLTKFIAAKLTRTDVVKKTARRTSLVPCLWVFEIIKPERYIIIFCALIPETVFSAIISGLPNTSEDYRSFLFSIISKHKFLSH